MSTKPEQNSFTETLREELEERGWSTKDLVKNSWMGEQAVIDILNGTRMGIREAEVISKALGVSPSFLLTLQRNSRKP
jgi:plasmid maintenance system antidote protein VapI